MASVAFSYDLTSNIGKVRRLIGDTIPNTGVTPTGANYTDAEIDFFLEQEGDNIYRAAAAAFETLAGAWAAVAGSLRIGIETEKQEQAKAYRQQAQLLRDRHGFNEETVTSSSFGFAVSVAR